MIIKCYNCSNNNSNYYCKDCLSFLCLKCLKLIHLNKIFLYHSYNLINLISYLKDKYNKNKFYCIICKKIHCYNCYNNPYYYSIYNNSNIEENNNFNNFNNFSHNPSYNQSLNSRNNNQDNFHYCHIINSFKNIFQIKIQNEIKLFESYINISKEYNNQIDNINESIGYYYDPLNKTNYGTYLNKRNEIIIYCEQIHELINQFEKQLLNQFDNYCDQKSIQLYNKKQFIINQLSSFNKYKEILNSFESNENDSFHNLSENDLDNQYEHLFYKFKELNKKWKPFEIIDNSSISIVLNKSFTNLELSLHNQGYIINEIVKPIDLNNMNTSKGILISWNLIKRNENNNEESIKIEETINLLEQKNYNNEIQFYYLIIKQIPSELINEEKEKTFPLKKCIYVTETLPFDLKEVSRTKVTKSSIFISTKDSLLTTAILIPSSLITYNDIIQFKEVKVEEVKKEEVKEDDKISEEMNIEETDSSSMNESQTLDKLIEITTNATYAPTSTTTTSTTPSSITKNNSTNDIMFENVNQITSSQEQDLISYSISGLGWLGSIAYDYYSPSNKTVLTSSLSSSTTIPKNNNTTNTEINTTDNNNSNNNNSNNSNDHNNSNNYDSNNNQLETEILNIELPLPEQFIQKNSFSFLLDDPIYCGCYVQSFLSIIPSLTLDYQSSFVSSSSIELIDEVYGQQFKYSSDFDTNGLLFYLGTRKYTTKYQNPYDIGIISVEWSSIWPTHKLSSFVSNQMITTGSCTKNIKNSWMMLSLPSNMYFIPTSYSLRHDIANQTHHLRSWILQGKENINDINWIDIKIHENDTSLNENNLTSTWLINKQTKEIEEINSYNKVKFVSYQTFRIYMTGPSNHLPEFDSWYLMCCGIEFYGTLIEKE